MGQMAQDVWQRFMFPCLKQTVFVSVSDVSLSVHLSVCLYVCPSVTHT